MTNQIMKKEKINKSKIKIECLLCFLWLQQKGCRLLYPRSCYTGRAESVLFQLGILIPITNACWILVVECLEIIGNILLQVEKKRYYMLIVRHASGLNPWTVKCVCCSAMLWPPEDRTTMALLFIVSTLFALVWMLEHVRLQNEI